MMRYTTPPDVTRCRNYNPNGPTPCYHPDCNCFPDKTNKALLRVAIVLALLGLLFLIGWIFPAGAADGTTNDFKLTPGDVRTTDKVMICTQKTSTIRHVSAATKRKAFRLYGLTNKTGWCPCEIDHLISLELGGSNDIKNLWPQSYVGKWNAHVKDRLENRLHKLICNGSVTPLAAQYAISHDWISAYKKYIGEPR